MAGLVQRNRVYTRKPLLAGFTFGRVNGPLTLPPGQYDIKAQSGQHTRSVHDARFIDSTITIASSQESTEVIALNDSGVPVLTTCGNDFHPVDAGEAFISVDYAGENSAVDLVVKPTKHMFMCRRSRFG